MGWGSCWVGWGNHWVGWRNCWVGWRLEMLGGVEGASGWLARLETHSMSLGSRSERLAIGVRLE